MEGSSEKISKQEAQYHSPTAPEFVFLDQMVASSQCINPKATDGWWKVTRLRIRTPAWARASLHLSVSAPYLQKMRLYMWISEIVSRSAFLWIFNCRDVFISLCPPSSRGQAQTLQPLSKGTRGFTASLASPNTQRWEEENQDCVPLSLKFLPRLLSS